MGIQDNPIEKNISIHPNPANENVFIEGINSEKYSIQLFDMSGRLLLKQDDVSGSELHLKNINEGVYNLCIKTPEGTINKILVIVH